MTIACSLVTGAINRTGDVTFPYISFVCLSLYFPFPLQLKRNAPLPIQLCTRYHLGPQGMCTHLYNLGSARTNSLNQRIITKHLAGTRHSQPVGPSHLQALPSLCIQQAGQCLVANACHPSPRDSLRIALPAIRVAPSNQPGCQRTLLTCKADDISFCLKAFRDSTELHTRV